MSRPIAGRWAGERCDPQFAMAEHQGRPAGPAHGPRGTSQRGAAWAPLFLILAGLSYVAMGALVRYIAESERLHPFQIAFLRNVMVLLPMLCLLRPLGISLLPSRHKAAWVPGRLRTGGHAVLVRGREPPAARGLHGNRLLGRADRGFGGESGPEGAARLRPAARHPGGPRGRTHHRPTRPGWHLGRRRGCAPQRPDDRALALRRGCSRRPSLHPPFSSTFSSSPRPSLGWRRPSPGPCHPVARSCSRGLRPPPEPRASTS